MLYSLAAEQMTGVKAEHGRLFYCTQRGNYSECEIDVNEDGRRYFDRAMRLIDEAIGEGFLPAAPTQGACAWCEYFTVCGPNEEVRVRRWKDGEALERLNQLRSLP